MDKATRNTLRNAVTEMRRILEAAISRELEGQYGIYASGKIDDLSLLRQLDNEGIENRERLLVHLEHIQANGFKVKEAVDQLKREIAFTHLNRFAAFKLMEQRGLIREAVSRGTDSQGFQFYLAEDEETERLYDTGQQDVAYRRFLMWQAEQFSDEISVLFSPVDSANFIFPPQRVLEQVLALLNSDELADIWTEDETIGWIYQYFTPKELRDQARKESQAPRNSYELAFRNQFYTPRYVVEFLTDNTLGRTWYEMLQGDTMLSEHCRYLVRRPNEIFMTEGEAAPEMGDTSHLSQEELLQQPVYIPYRAYKDPRRLKILDPACGSGHFLLYCFDLLAIIYEEAWERDLQDPAMGSLRDDYPALPDLRRDIPRLILRNNLHGIDIDLRATQIAALALWLRGQRYYNEMDIKPHTRPKITQGNIVLAEPMPGDKALLDEFTTTLNPPVLGDLVRRVFEKMELAGEAGSLLKIEEAIQEDIQTAKKLWERGPTPEQLALFPDLVTEREAKQLSLFDVSAIGDAQFFDQAEKLVLDALERYAQHATNGKGLQRRLFAEDAAGGFAFIDMLRKRFDVTLMNPPFGEYSRSYKSLARREHSNAYMDIYAAFVTRFTEALQDRGLLGAITSRTGFYISSLSVWRSDLIENNTFTTFMDLGNGVLDSALVSTAAYTIERNHFSRQAVVIPLLDVNSENHQSFLGPKLDINLLGERLIFMDFSRFERLPGAPFPYWLSDHAIRIFANRPPFKSDTRDVKVGLQTGDNFQFVRLFWEVSPLNIGSDLTWLPYAKGGDYSPYYRDIELVVLWENDGYAIKNFFGGDGRLRSRPQNTDFYYRAGLTFTIYTIKGFNIRPLPSGCVFDVAGSSVFVQGDNHDNLLYILAFMNSSVFQFLISAISDNRKWQVGLIQVIPWIEPDIGTRQSIISEVKQIYYTARAMRSFIETEHIFTPPPLNEDINTLHANLTNFLLVNQSEVNKRETKILEKLCEVYSLSKSELIRTVNFTEDDYEEIDGKVNLEDEVPIEWVEKTEYATFVVSYSVGVVLGRWDICYATGDKPIPELPDPFDPLPVCPPGMLQNADGLPATETPPNYPIEIDWDGILVDDPDHPDDIIRRVRDVLVVLWGDRAEDIEAEACDILGVKSLRDYFRKSGKGGFWDAHVKRYTKSRRKAPIYWYLQSSKGNYGLWLYYHRLDADLYYKTLVNYVEPKLQLEENRLNDLMAQVPDGGSASRQLQKQIDDQEEFLSELHDFRDKLKRAADLRLQPDLNDGVVLNIAALHELVPWSEAAKYWNELLEGQYDWSSISQQLLERRLVK